MNIHNSVVTVVLQIRGCAKAEPNHRGWLVGHGRTDGRTDGRITSLPFPSFVVKEEERWRLHMYWDAARGVWRGYRWYLLP